MPSKTPGPIRLFISYSRRDLEPARTLAEDLGSNEDFEVKIDFRDLPFGEKFKPELSDLIRDCDTVLWLLTPDSVRSWWCQWELGEVARMHKRLVPVKLRDVDRKACRSYSPTSMSSPRKASTMPRGTFPPWSRS
uniref:TIR domain-containing protein n=1 Tax=Candidatus Kentrum sp. FW TaxID=2126338 RepID=A0A450TFR2_9GAMM|nr:MAG: TIR domain-containing protein [Candidatus Kentron sp. FW]